MKKYNNRNKNKYKYKYTTVYSKKDYDRDKQNFLNAEKTGKVDFASFKRLLLHDIYTNTHIIEDGCIGDVKIEDINLALEHPRQGWRIILQVSEKLMQISPYYFRLNNLYSNMALFCWGIDLDIKENANIAIIKKMYSSLASKLESMNLKHEFSKIMKVIPYQDVFCGLIFENQTDFFIQQVNFRICKLYEVQEGLYNFIINLSAINPQNLVAYPDYVQQAYIDFKDGKLNSNWYYPPSDKQICIKLNSQWTYPYPLLIGLIRDILDLDVYKKLKLQSARTDNYKAIMVKVPIDESTIDKPLLTPEALEVFSEINKENMTDDIGLIHTLGSEGKAISFKDSNNTRNNVSDAVDNLYDDSGVSKELFNGSSSGTALSYSIENDAGFIYNLYRQFERWTNRFIKLRKYNKFTFKFYFYLLDITIFNRDNVSSRYKDAISMGVTCIDKYLASIDVTPSRILGSYIIHENIFDFRNHFIPLQTSYNSSITNNDVGRPTNESKGELLDVAGEQTQNNDSNSKR